MVRTLESAALAAGGGQVEDGPIRPHSGATEIFISPGFEFRLVGAILTNFHLPKSSLLMLVSAFAGRKRVLAAYEHAVRQKYRFFSYGDCMFVASAVSGQGPRSGLAAAAGGSSATRLLCADPC